MNATTVSILRTWTGRLAWFSLASGLAGCPIFPAERDRADVRTATPTPAVAGECSKPSDCASTLTCGAKGLCTSATCATAGCVGDYECRLVRGILGCFGASEGPDGGDRTLCLDDNECAEALDDAHAKCLSGECYERGRLCSDRSQCGAGKCVDGACVAECSASKACPVGYGCDLDRGACLLNNARCENANACSSGYECADGRCVPACSSVSQCVGPGLACVAGGCVFDERPRQLCSIDGEAGDGTSGHCDSGRVCYRGACYAPCEVLDAGEPADGGGDAAQALGCGANQSCRTRSLTSGALAICTESDGFGEECDPPSGLLCPTKTLVCVDGFCR